jgi:hypothetical protein
MKMNLSRLAGGAFLSLAVAVLTGCASISQRTNAYLGAPKYPASDPAVIQILQAEPNQPKERLGEIILTVEGEPSRDALEKKLREGAARLGADAVFIVHDKMHIFPMVYGDWWWGPMGVTEDAHRKIVGVAVKLK